MEGEDSPERGHDDQSEGVPELSEVKLCRSRRKKCAYCAPGHAAVDGEVEGVGEVDAEVDGGRDVFCQLVIKKFHHTVLQKRESLIKLKCTGSIRKVFSLLISAKNVDTITMCTNVQTEASLKMLLSLLLALPIYIFNFCLQNFLIYRTTCSDKLNNFNNMHSKIAQKYLWIPLYLH